MKEVTVEVNFLKHLLGAKVYECDVTVCEGMLVFYIYIYIYSVKSHKLLSFTYFTIIRKSYLYVYVQSVKLGPEMFLKTSEELARLQIKRAT